MEEIRGPTVNSETNQRLVSTGAKSQYYLETSGRKSVATSIQGWSCLEEPENSDDLNGRGNRRDASIGHLTPPASPSKKKEGKALALPSFSQFLLLANPGRNCWHRSLGKNEAHKGLLLTKQRKEGWGMDRKANRPRFSRTINFVQEHKWWWRKRLDWISIHPGIHARSWL